MHRVGARGEIRVLLFDVGGVLVQLGGVTVILEWLGNRMSAEELWRRWLQSAAVRQFETGQIDAWTFAAGVIAEFELPVGPRQFLDSFVGWPTGLYPGTLEMLECIPRRYQRALLSNSNALHWPRVLDEMGLGPAFDNHFVSHLTGRIKPDPAAFEHVLATLGCSAEQVLFLDDIALNVEAARTLGMNAVQVQGLTETRQALIRIGILDEPL
ncbi:MAG: HAD family phosphatase [Steroidobacteraceae bacterium]|jgi:putative hydrolase of the HAD superfamily